MPDTKNVDLKIKRLTRVEAEYRTEIKRAQIDMKRDPDRKKRYERIVTNREKKIEKLGRKIRHLREVRARIRAS